jgi:hypothetical protein
MPNTSKTKPETNPELSHEALDIIADWLLTLPDHEPTPPPPPKPKRVVVKKGR